MSLPRAYLAMKLTQPLPIRGGPVLRTVGEAANYVLELPQSQVEGCQRWRQAAQLLLDQAGVAEVSKQVKLALFYDAQTSRPWSRERSSRAIQGRVGRPSRRGRGRAFHPLHRLWRLDELPRSRPSVRARRAVVAPGAGSTAMTGAQFEIRIDGSACSYRDRKDYAMEATRLIKSKNPHSMVVKCATLRRGRQPSRVKTCATRREPQQPGRGSGFAALAPSCVSAIRLGDGRVVAIGQAVLRGQTCGRRLRSDTADFADAERRDCGGNGHPDDRSRDAARHIESPDKLAVTPAVPSRPGCSPRQLNRRSRSCWCGHIRGLPGSTGRQRPERSRTRRRPEQGPEQSWSS